MLSAQQILSTPNKRRPVRSLREQYELYIKDRIAHYNNKLSREELLRQADEAMVDLRGDEQFLLTEVLAQRPPWTTTSRNVSASGASAPGASRSLLRAAQRDPTSMGNGRQSPGRGPSRRASKRAIRFSWSAAAPNRAPTPSGGGVRQRGDSSSIAISVSWPGPRTLDCQRVVVIVVRSDLRAVRQVAPADQWQLSAGGARRGNAGITEPERERRVLLAELQGLGPRTRRPPCPGPRCDG